jgi:tyrosyl-tRNA synthetase
MKINTDPQKIEELLERGVERIEIKDHLKKRLQAGEKLRVKFGIDPTGPVIHLGNAIPIRKLKQFQELGHQVVFLIGDFTARIGDTSDKNAIRQSLSEEEIEGNMKTYKAQLAKMLNIEQTEFVYNSEWLSKLSFEDLLKLQSQFTVAQMIERENFNDRYKSGKPIGLQEFTYPLMQGYDSVAIKADVELGGTDQIFNMLTGRVIQRVYGQEPQDIMALALLEGTDGRKMSKSYGNIIGISDKPDEMYGKTMSMKDELIIRYFILCTDVPAKEIKNIEKELKEGKTNPRDAKARLAKEIVALYHGQKAAGGAGKEFDKVFKRKELPTAIEEVKLKEDVGAAHKRPILDLLMQTKLSPSKSEAKRLVEQGAVKIDGRVEKDWQKQVEIKEGMIIQAGKRKFIRIKK